MMKVMSMPQARIVRPLGMRDFAADELRRALLEGQFRRGEDISEVALADRLQVSRGPIREALVILAQEGLLRHHHNRGFSVLNFTEADAEAIGQVRVPLESMALELGRARVSAQTLTKLERLRDELITAFQERGTPGSVPAELNFHSAIWEASGNEWLVTSLRRVMVPFFSYVSALAMNRPDLNSDLLYRQHTMYVDYLRSANGLTAEYCVLFHLGKIA